MALVGRCWIEGEESGFLEEKGGEEEGERRESGVRIGTSSPLLPCNNRLRSQHGEREQTEAIELV